MTSIADQMLVVYCFVDDFLKAHPGQTSWRASNNSTPVLSSSQRRQHTGLAQVVMQHLELDRVPETMP